VRNFVRYSRPVFPVPAGQMPEWQIMLRLAGIVAGQGPDASIEALDDFVFEQQLEKTIGSEHSPAYGKTAEQVRAAVAGRRGPERLLDLMLRTGPYGDGFGARDGLTLAKLEQSDHAIDLGPLMPRLPDLLRTPSGKIELSPESIVADLDRLRAKLSPRASAERPLLLVGRRDLRSNNSWMHNVEALVSGKARCTLHLHPDDARTLGLEDGATARVRSRAGSIEVPVEVTDGIMRGVVSVPHGWGHGESGMRLGVASRVAGANSNRLAEEDRFDPISGNAVLNGIEVHVERAIDANP
jgi:anaerobic selenocysteine-containing dehydrogenase